MTDVAAPAPPATSESPTRRRVMKILAWILGILAILVLLHVAGIDVWGWFQELWDTVTGISVGYVILGCIFQGLQTALTGLGWYGILRYAYPGATTYLPVLTAYAVGVSLNNFVPANLGTFVTLIMFVAIVQGATFSGVLGGYVVQKVFYLVIGTLIYVYLFSQVTGSLDYQFGNEWDALSGHPVLVIGIAAGAVFLVALLLRIFKRWVRKFWEEAKEGGAILGDLGAFGKWVLLPQMGGYAAKVGVIAVFLAAYGIPVTFGSIMSILGSNQLANILSFTPGGIGVNQAFNSFALDSYTDATTATAYSTSQQLITTAFNAVFAIVLLCHVFGWSGGSKLVKESYADAKVKKEAASEERRQKKEAKRAARETEGRSGLLSVFRRSEDDASDENSSSGDG
jgi:uncharacterized membrane protein YbhN (UPF0104 family)